MIMKHYTLREIIFFTAMLMLYPNRVIPGFDGLHRGDVFNEIRGGAVPLI